MKKKSPAKQKEEPKQDPSTMTAGENFWKELQEMPYSEDRIGQSVLCSPITRFTGPGQQGFLGSKAG